jgi:Xaa-Pro aminopeptidase
MKEKINSLKKLFSDYNIDGYIIPSGDEFFSEYTPEFLNRLKWITDLPCSNAMAIITVDKNYFFTDGRYLEAANNKLAKDFEIVDITELSPWKFVQNSNYIFGVSPNLVISKPEIQNLRYITELVDLIWKRDLTPPDAKYFKYDSQYSGLTFNEKLSKLQEIISNANADSLILTTPDIICWLTNLRGNDVLYSPLILSYAIVSVKEGVELFVYNKTAELPQIKNISFNNFDEFFERIKTLKKPMLDPQLTPAAIIRKLEQSYIPITNPCLKLKAIKNPVEINNAKEVHIIDAVAVCKLLAWIRTDITEQDVIDKSNELRSLSERFFSPSFNTIAGFKENGAIIHYHVSVDSNKTIKGSGLLLIDSGGQYFGGTTDITRTIAIGTPTIEQKKAYTLVLKGHLALSNTVFQKGTTGSQLDKLARYHLKKNKMNYAHGTGHGVGNFLSVHESPPNISPRSNIPFEAGMIVSNEPGYYKTGEFGIRIENMIHVIETKDGMLAMEDLTLVPYDHHLIDFSMINEQEMIWLKKYYNKIKTKLSPFFSAEFLENACFLPNN